ncbi:ATP-binding cassette domain-containing protein [Fusobacterium periodonticum]|uniref:ABC transporter domain-containing protein n=1 Tax=Fusobacterium periodonticum D10 TaxID=620833 RepID=K1GJR8_9FUSO|nr:ATP-binding cassette domain-containing protein [Fusobacterium periodonticum]EKA93590.1 hypothetical protein FPOG_01075 [Fusobacterium periodonticum D10]
MNEKYILEVKDLEYTYGDGTHALKGINLKIEKGKKIAIIGVNGSGKSTLFLNMNGVLKATKGEIYFKGEKIAYDKKSLMELRKKNRYSISKSRNYAFFFKCLSRSFLWSNEFKTG